MRDVDQGFWRFCTSYNDAFPLLAPARDPVVKLFHNLSQFPYVQLGTREWVQVGVADRNAAFDVAIDVLRRPWRANGFGGRVSGEPGFLYNVRIGARDRRTFEYSRLLEDTKRLHPHFVHIVLDSFMSSVRVTIPAVLGTRKTNNAIREFIRWVPNSLRRRSVEADDRGDKVEHIVGEWPEYVIGPRNPLSFLGPDMPCSFFSV
jgi:hypothetical protein